MTELRPLRVAIPKGRLEADLFAYLRHAGLPVTAFADTRQLTQTTADGQFEYILAKPTDVSTFVAYGGADVGFTGLDTLREEGVDVIETFTLPLGYCHLSLAGPPAWQGCSLHLSSQLRVATKYTRLASAFFMAHGINAEIIKLNGSVELAPLTGMADIILDLVETGNTLRAHGLVELHHIMDSQLVVIVNRSAYRLRVDCIDPFLHQLRSARDSHDTRQSMASDRASTPARILPETARSQYGPHN